MTKEFVVVAGDSNDEANNPPVHPLQNLLTTPNLRDVLDSPFPTFPLSPTLPLTHRITGPPGRSSARSTR